MADAKRDANRVPTLIGVSNADMSTPAKIAVDPDTGRLLVSAEIITAAATGVKDGAVVDADNEGLLILGTDGSNYQVLKVNSDGELAVNLETGDIQIGAVEIKNGADDTRALVVAATSDSDPDLDGTNLLGVHALLSARKDADTTIGITATDGTYNALHIAITDGTEIVNVNASNELQTRDDDANTLLGTIDADTSTLAGAVSGTEMQVDVVTMPTTTVEATNLDVRDLDETQDAVSAKLATDSIMNDKTALTPKFAAIDVAGSGDNTLVAAVVGKKIRVLACYLIASASVTARFEDGAGGSALSGQMILASSGGFVLPFNPVGWFETTANTLLNLELSAAISVDGGLVYVEV